MRLTCPQCGSSIIHRSHSRSSIENIFQRMPFFSLYRCRFCNWRGWVKQLALLFR